LLAIHTATSAKNSRLLSLKGSRSQDLTVRPLAPQNPNFLTQPGLEIRTIVPPDKDMRIMDHLGSAGRMRPAKNSSAEYLTMGWRSSRCEEITGSVS
jgi:hypothetical protein